MEKSYTLIIDFYWKKVQLDCCCHYAIMYVTLNVAFIL